MVEEEKSKVSFPKIELFYKLIWQVALSFSFAEVFFFSRKQDSGLSPSLTVPKLVNQQVAAISVLPLKQVHRSVAVPEPGGKHGHWYSVLASVNRFQIKHDHDSRKKSKIDVTVEWSRRRATNRQGTVRQTNRKKRKQKSGTAKRRVCLPYEWTLERHLWTNVYFYN